jgi:two-component system OmpR family sensor kinase
MAMEPVDVSTVIKEAVASARAAGPDHEILMDLPDEDLFVLGDSLRVHQVIANLLANARVHTPAGTKVSVSARQDDSGTYISVADNGPGLSKEAQEKIFERFYRADPSRVRNGVEGTGLGLSIVDAVMNAHGGNVTVESDLGKGSTFTLFFPITEL